MEQEPEEQEPIWSGIRNDWPVAVVGGSWVEGNAWGDGSAW
jgi:hypothetical protein